MREIRFRAWFIGSERMLENVSYPMEASPAHEVCEYMQYTGLKDKNGIEIYEGDIVRRGEKMPDNVPIKNTYTIVFDDGCFSCAEMEGIRLGESWGIKFVAGAYISELEVIGNIYENPELLK